MFIKRIRKKEPPVGYVNIVDAVKHLGQGKFGPEWLEARYVKQLPFRIGKPVPGKPRRMLEHYAWEYASGEYESIEMEWSIPAKRLAEARQAREEFKTVCEQLHAAVRARQIGIRFQSVDGEHSFSEAPPGIMRTQWHWIMETGQVRVRRKGERERLWTVFFEEKRIITLRNGQSLRARSKDVALTEDQCIAQAKLIMLDLKSSVSNTNVKLDRGDYESAVQRLLGGQMTDDLFEREIWKSKWCEENKIVRLKGKQTRFRKRDAEQAVATFIEKNRQKYASSSRQG